MQKTGTSAIQVFLHQNRKKLLQQRIRYPAIDEFSKVDFKGVPYHNCVAAALGGFHSAFPAVSVDDLKTLRGIIDFSDERVLLSGEDFSRMLNLSGIAQFVSGLTVHVVLYIRDPVSWVQSIYNQRNKLLFFWGHEKIFDPSILTPDDLFDFLEKENYAPLLDYDGLISRWESIAQSVDVRIYPPKQSEEYSLISDFSSSLGIENIEGYKLPGRINENLDNRWIAWIQSIDANEGREAALKELKLMVERVNRGELNLSGETKVLTGWSKNKIIDLCSESNEKMTKRLKRDDLFSALPLKVCHKKQEKFHPTLETIDGKEP